MVKIYTFEGNDLSTYTFFALSSFAFHALYIAILIVAFTGYSQNNEMTFVYIALPVLGLVLTNVVFILTRMKMYKLDERVFLVLSYAIFGSILWMTHILFFELQLNYQHN